MEKDKLRKFCEHYEVQVLNDQNRTQRYRRPNFFGHPLDADVIDIASEFYEERLYTVQIPESRLKTLVEMEEMFFRAREHGQGKDMFDMLMEKEREERNFRNTNEAVKKAYEQYSMLLNLAGYQRKI